jgi:hypothetical protein
MSLNNDNQTGRDPNDIPEWLELVRKHVESLKFGTVQITVHESRVTQVERVEKVRLDQPAMRLRGSRSPGQL